MPKLAATVHGLRDPETNRTVSFSAGADVPDWVREQVTNPAAWEAPSTGADAPIAATATIDEVEEWVGDDPDRARQALAAEQARPEPRKTLVAKLERILDEE